MSDIHNSKPGDVFVDPEGKLWRVIGTCNEPTVHMREIEPRSITNPQDIRGGIGGLMWVGFKKIYEAKHELMPKIVCDPSMEAEEWGLK